MQGHKESPALSSHISASVCAIADLPAPAAPYSHDQSLWVNSSAYPVDEFLDDYLARVGMAFWCVELLSFWRVVDGA